MTKARRRVRTSAAETRAMHALERARVEAVPTNEFGAIDRRTLLAMIVGGAAALGVGPLVLTSCSDESEVESVVASVAAIGKAYRAIPGAVTSKDELEQRLGITGAAIDERDLTRFRDAISNDFKSGKVVEVEGWVLAETEAFAAALVSLV